MTSGLNVQLKSIYQVMQNGSFAAAEDAINKLKAEYGSSADLWALASELSLRQGKIQEALTQIDKAITLDEISATRHVQRARCAILCGLIAEAKTSVEKAIKLGVDTPDEQLMLASVKVRYGDLEGALDSYKKVEAIQPARIELQQGLASVYRFLGEIEKAEQACNKALAINPHDYETLNLRSSLRTHTKESNHLPELTGLLEQGVKNWRGAVHVAYAAAKEYEDLGEFDHAFKYLQQGASLRRRNTKYNVKDDIQIFTAIREAFSQQAIENAGGNGYKSDQPVFILGLPRTGSTLIERIISSHSEVTTAGELNDFAIELMKLVSLKNKGEQPGRLTLPRETLSVDMHALGKNYINAVKPLIGVFPRFIDKLPLNSLYVGLIYLALPNAKVIHVKRHPLDTCFAMYKYLFKNAYPFSYDLNELGDYFIEHNKLMQHWYEILPEGWFCEVCYEDVVRDQEKETRDLLNYLGLAWEAECLTFHENPQASTTGSASQVREPIYRSSVGKWRHYKEELQPLADKLQASGIYLD